MTANSDENSSEEQSESPEARPKCVPTIGSGGGSRQDLGHDQDRRVAGNSPLGLFVGWCMPLPFWPFFRLAFSTFSSQRSSMEFKGRLAAYPRSG